MMKILAQHGPFAVIAGGLIYLFVLVWKRFNELFQQQHDALVEDTKSKGKLTQALEDNTAAIEALGDRVSADVGACKAMSADMRKVIGKYLNDQQLERAKEEGRREATNPRIRIPGGENDAP